LKITGYSRLTCSKFSIEDPQKARATIQNSDDWIFVSLV